MPYVSVNVRFGEKSRRFELWGDVVELGSGAACALVLPFSWVMPVHVLLAGVGIHTTIRPGVGLDGRPARVSVNDEFIGPDPTPFAAGGTIVIHGEAGQQVEISATVHAAAAPESSAAVPIDPAMALAMTTPPVGSPAVGSPVVGASVVTGSGLRGADVVVVGGGGAMTPGVASAASAQRGASSQRTPQVPVSGRPTWLRAAPLMTAGMAVGAILVSMLWVAIASTRSTPTGGDAGPRAQRQAVLSGRTGGGEVDPAMLEVDRLSESAAAAFVATRLDAARDAARQAQAIAVEARGRGVTVSTAVADAVLKSIEQQRRLDQAGQQPAVDQLVEAAVEQERQRLRQQQDAFAREQREKGLVLQDGRWMTPAEAAQSRGMVEFEGKWVEPEVRVRALAEREAQGRAARTNEWQLAGGGENVKQSDMGRQAYEQARRFVRVRMGMPDAPVAGVIDAAGAANDAGGASPREAAAAILPEGDLQFPDIDSDRVTVLYEDGFYTVRGTFDQYDSRHVPTRFLYIIRLRPLGDQWEQQGVEIIY